jgi:chloramphenicol-sensitive protein RarD
VAAIGAYTLWGLLPIYWKALQEVPALETLAHRTIWSLVFVLLLQAVLRRWEWLRLVRQQPRMLRTFLASTCLLAVNWLTYIWAVTSGHVVDSSLGYFINPLVSVLLGVLFLRERLRLWQGVAVGLAAASVLYLTLGVGGLPWIALVLASTFGFYGLLRKTAPLGSLEGLTVETALLSLPALAYLLSLQALGLGSFGHAGAATTALLAFTGVVTAVPLLLFATAARNTTLATVGILQYIAPTLQLLLGLLVYHEPFSPARLLGFCGVWLALLIYSVEAMLQEHLRRTAAATGTG